MPPGGASRALNLLKKRDDKPVLGLSPRFLTDALREYFSREAQ